MAFTVDLAARHPLDEDRVRAAANRLRNPADARRLWDAYQGWCWAPDSEREWARRTVGA